VRDILTTNPVKEKLRGGQLVYGAWITTPNRVVAEIMALAGFDFLVIDTEHGAIDVESVQSLIQSMAATETVSIVRLPGIDRAYLTNILDTGPHGVIVPMVNSRDEATAAVRAVRYPPEGTRGIGLARVHRFDPQYRDEYLKIANELMLIGIQIEHRDAVDHIAEIISTPGIDFVLLGPTDLAGSLGYAGQSGHPDVARAIEKVAQACREAGMPMGIPIAGCTDLEARARQGFQFLHLGADMFLLGQACKNRLSEARKTIAGMAKSG
jgi:2-dehydro-3-deoxyglucarate aldolase